MVPEDGKRVRRVLFGLQDLHDLDATHLPFEEAGPPPVIVLESRDATDDLNDRILFEIAIHRKTNGTDALALPIGIGMIRIGAVGNRGVTRDPKRETARRYTVERPIFTDGRN